MSKIPKSPAKYVQGPDTLRILDQYLQGMGNRLLIITSPNGMKRMRGTLQSCFSGKPYELTYEQFQGEGSQRQIDRLTNCAIDIRSDDKSRCPWTRVSPA